MPSMNQGGGELPVLVHEGRNARVSEVKFDAAGLSRGVYFCRLQAGDFTHTRKVCLTR
jgi:hypothetical protein